MTFLPMWVVIVAVVPLRTLVRLIVSLSGMGVAPWLFTFWWIVSIGDSIAPAICTVLPIPDAIAALLARASVFRSTEVGEEIVTTAMVKSSSTASETPS